MSERPTRSIGHREKAAPPVEYDSSQENRQDQEDKSE
jgi:hypothetical protein